VGKKQFTHNRQREPIFVEEKTEKNEKIQRDVQKSLPVLLIPKRGLILSFSKGTGEKAQGNLNNASKKAGSTKKGQRDEKRNNTKAKLKKRTDTPTPNS